MSVEEMVQKLVDFVCERSEKMEKAIEIGKADFLDNTDDGAQQEEGPGQPQELADSELVRNLNNRRTKKYSVMVGGLNNGIKTKMSIQMGPGGAPSPKGERGAVVVRKSIMVTTSDGKVVQQKNTKKVEHKLKCPRCGKEDFECARDLGKHAMKCKAGEQKMGDNGKADDKLSMLGNDRMAQLMRIKRMQNKHEEEERTKEEQARIDKEMELLIKMEKAREKRDEALRKKKELEEKHAKENELVLKAQREEEEKQRQEKLELERKLEERAKQLMGDDSDSDDESEDEATKERRARLQAQIQQQQQKQAVKPNEDSSNDKTDPKAPVQEESTEEEAEEFDWLESPYEGYTAAHMAAYYNDTYYMGKVIELGGDLVSQDPEGRTPLFICVLYGHDETMELLIKHWQEDEQQPKQQNTTEKATRSVDNQGMTPLACAASVGNFNAIPLLVEVDPESLSICDGNGDTPLHHACYYQYSDCVNMLLTLGADADGPPNYSGVSPAAMCSTVETLSAVVDYGADFYGIDLQGRSVLFYACANNSVDLVQYLVDIDEAGHSLSYADIRGDTPLHAAACNGNSECIKILLQKGVDAGVLNVTGLTAATLALCHDHTDAVQVFKEFDIEPQDLENLELPEEDDQNPIWMEYTDQESGCSYWYNVETGESSWEKPISTYRRASSLTSSMSLDVVQEHTGEAEHDQ